MPEPSDSRRSGAGVAVAAPVETGCWLSIEVVLDGGEWEMLSDAAALAEAASRAVALSPSIDGTDPALACIALSNDATVRDLNKRFRGQDKATNVLSFPAPPAQHERDGLPRLGDIALAFETVAREAQEQGVSLAHHFQHLVVHGLLHLLGFDHETEGEAEEMEGLEVEILATLGIGNPYTQEVETHSL